MYCNFLGFYSVNIAKDAAQNKLCQKLTRNKIIVVLINIKKQEI